MVGRTLAPVGAVSEVANLQQLLVASQRVRDVTSGHYGFGVGQRFLKVLLSGQRARFSRTASTFNQIGRKLNNRKTQ